MRKQGKDLEFISFIKRDGTGTIMCGTEWDDEKNYPKIDDMYYLDNEYFDIYTLSLTDGTFIAHGLNSFVVK